MMEEIWMKKAIATFWDCYFMNYSKENIFLKE